VFFFFDGYTRYKRWILILSFGRNSEGGSNRNTFVKIRAGMGSWIAILVTRIRVWCTRRETRLGWIRVTRILWRQDRVCVEWIRGMKTRIRVRRRSRIELRLGWIRRWHMS